ncbi:alcohol dehydrogenase [Fusarium agapanthi]|uniref:Alcohol dehydrogenase n=1 Tax=Fusarium agapanthi TaxID=1803897 RepID=A0A9P5AXU8_9HYPO|nr:alcohol dehydrogenase [Fusarium agapanthi]
MSLQGKVILITGGAKNLGAEIALSLASVGASLALHYNSPSTKDNAHDLAKTIRQSFPKVKYAFYQGDLTTKAAVDSLFASVLKDFGKIDIVINTIGKVLKKPIAEISEAEYDGMFDVNSKSAFLILQAGAKHVEDGGKIITIVTALLAAFTGFYTSYAGSKAPVEHFTRGVAKELMGRRISVNAVAPGPMDTPRPVAFFYPQEADDSVAFHKSQALEGRLTDIKDIAPLVKFLVTEGGWITGQTIFANGGYTTR